MKESQSQELTRWHGVERETSRRGYYVPWVKGGMNKVLGSTAKKYASRYIQL